MNAIRRFTYLSLGGYRSYRGSISTRRSQPQRQNNIIRPGISDEEFDLDRLEDPEDLDAHHSELKNVKEYNRIHERELDIQKLKLKTQIVKRKYFSTKEPAMLTWGEKEQIRFLHSKDPEEWSPDKLSDSFPASREAILKVIRSKWVPKEVKMVEKYEAIVKENWARFKAGKLAIEPELRDHLEKFKDREITTMDRKTIAKKIIKHKTEFKNPESNLFSSLITNYQDTNKANEKERMKLIVEKSEKKKTFVDITSSEKIEDMKIVTKKLEINRKIHPREMLTVDQFLHKHVENVNEDKMTSVDRVIIDETKRQSTEAYKTQSLLMFKSESPVDSWNDHDEKDEKSNTVKNVEKYEDFAAPAIREDKQAQLDLASVLEGSLETGIIAREIKAHAESEDYPQFIQIPRKKYKSGATYRIKDRYYDNDGEFLYRVPGLKS